MVMVVVGRQDRDADEEALEERRHHAQAPQRPCEDRQGSQPPPRRRDEHEAAMGDPPHVAARPLARKARGEPQMLRRELERGTHRDQRTYGNGPGEQELPPRPRRPDRGEDRAMQRVGHQQPRRAGGDEVRLQPHPQVDQVVARRDEGQNQPPPVPPRAPARLETRDLHQSDIGVVDRPDPDAAVMIDHMAPRVVAHVDGHDERAERLADPGVHLHPAGHASMGGVMRVAGERPGAVDDQEPGEAEQPPVLGRGRGGVPASGDAERDLGEVDADRPPGRDVQDGTLSTGGPAAHEGDQRLRPCRKSLEAFPRRHSGFEQAHTRPQRGSFLEKQRRQKSGKIVQNEINTYAFIQD
jgi:hypothetical protein